MRGFSAGSYSGICLLHLLWQLPFVDARGKLGGIACPPELLSTIPADKGQGLHLFHYERDSSVAGSQPSTISKVFTVCVPWLPMNGRTSMITLAKVSMIMDTGLICRCRQESFSCGAFYKNYPMQQPPSFEMSPDANDDAAQGVLVLNCVLPQNSSVVDVGMPCSLNCCSSDVSLEADEENHAVVTCDGGSDVSSEVARVIPGWLRPLVVLKLVRVIPYLLIVKGMHRARDAGDLSRLRSALARR